MFQEDVLLLTTCLLFKDCEPADFCYIFLSQEPQLFLVGLCSLGLAAKMGEADRRIPKVAALRPFIRDAFTPAEFLQVRFEGSAVCYV